jgi:hypothetical protein
MYVRGVFRIKCPGRNNFNTNHFRSLAISGLFKAFSLPIWMYHSHWSIYRRKAAADSFLLLIWATPSKFFMRQPWDSERPAGFDFASLKQKKVCRSRLRQIERLADRLDAFVAIKSPRMRRQQSVSLSLHKNQPWDDDMGLFGLKIGWDIARGFLMEAASMASPQDLLYSSSNSNHNDGGHFCHFVIFLSLTAIMIKFVRMIYRVFSQSILSTNSFIFAKFWQP